MPELHDLLAAEAARGGPVATPPFETVLARARHRRVMQLSGVMAVVLAVGAVVAIPTLGRSHRAGVGTVGGAGATTEAARKALTQQAANQFADAVHMPPGAVTQPSAPSQLLAEQMNSLNTQNLVDVVRFFTVPGTVETVLAFVSAHPPSGMFENGSESSSTDGLNLMQGVTFSALATHDYAAPRVSVVTTKFGAGVAVRVDADLVWRPLRTAAEQVPVDATATICRFTTTICADGYAVVDHATTRELATFFNSLDARPPGDENCPAVSSLTKIEFTTAHGSLAFNPSACGGVVVSFAGVRQPTLDLPDTVPVDLQTLLGLNADLASSPAPDQSAGSSFAVASAPASQLSSPVR